MNKYIALQCFIVQKHHISLKQHMHFYHISLSALFRCDYTYIRKNFFELSKKKYTPDSTDACKEIERIENQESTFFCRVWMGKTVKMREKVIMIPLPNILCS